jgi:hypothetical protein
MIKGIDKVAAAMDADRGFTFQVDVPEGQPDLTADDHEQIATLMLQQQMLNTPEFMQSLFLHSFRENAKKKTNNIRSKLNWIHPRPAGLGALTWPVLQAMRVAQKTHLTDVGVEPVALRYQRLKRAPNSPESRADMDEAAKLVMRNLPAAR